MRGMSEHEIFECGGPAKLGPPRGVFPPLRSPRRARFATRNLANLYMASRSSDERRCEVVRGARARATKSWVERGYQLGFTGITQWSRRRKPPADSRDAGQSPVRRTGSSPDPCRLHCPQFGIAPQMLRWVVVAGAQPGETPLEDVHGRLCVRVVGTCAGLVSPTVPFRSSYLVC